MDKQYETPTCPAPIMCKDCKGIGKLGGSSYVVESCAICGGTGMVQREVEEND